MNFLSKVLRFIGFGFLFVLTVILVLLINFLFSTPKVSMNKLPSNLIANNSEVGQKLLAESEFRADYALLQENFVSQSRRAFCGVASSVTVLNSLRGSSPLINQSSIFNNKTRKVIHPLKVTFGGMTLAQLNGLLQTNELKTKLIYAADINIEEFRSLTQKNLNNSHDLVLVNYRRPALNQSGGGHISPLAAYHQASDRFLILDVAAYKYPPTWVKTKELWNGINSVDQTSKLSRGLIMVQN